MTHSVCWGSKVRFYCDRLEKFMQVELKRTERENVISMCILPIYEFRIECMFIQFNIPCQFYTAIHEQILDQI